MILRDYGSFYVGPSAQPTHRPAPTYPGRSWEPRQMSGLSGITGTAWTLFKIALTVGIIKTFWK